MKTLIIFLVSYLISILILYFACVKIKLLQWTSKEKKYKYIALAITFAIYISGTMTMESFILNENLRYMVRGILLAIFITPLMKPRATKEKN